jgi:hypothetical protein
MSVLIAMSGLMADFYFEVYEDAFEWKTYFKTNIDPLIINSDANDA